MTVVELIQLARLLIRWSCYLEPLPSEQKKGLELAIDVLMEAQHMVDAEKLLPEVSDLPF